MLRAIEQPRPAESPAPNLTSSTIATPKIDGPEFCCRERSTARQECSGPFVIIGDNIEPVRADLVGIINLKHSRYSRRQDTTIWEARQPLETDASSQACNDIAASLRLPLSPSGTPENPEGTPPSRPDSGIPEMSSESPI